MARNKPLRTFVAVELTAEVRARLAELLTALRPSGQRVRWVAPENLHVTMKFLGSTDERLVPDVCEALRRATRGLRPFVCPVVGVGSFPPKGAPRVIWAGLGDPENLLVPFAGRVDAELADTGFAPEKRRFAAHVTLGRLRDRKAPESLVSEIAARAEEDFGELEVDTVTLFMSELSPAGARYTKLCTVNL